MRLLAAAFACLAALSAGAQPAPPQPLKPPFAAPPDPQQTERLDQLQQEIADAMVREGVPGAAVVLVDGQGIVWMGGFGESDPARGRQATPATPFAAAAISPVLVGMLAARYAALNSDPIQEGEPKRVPLEEPLENVHPIALDGAASVESALGLGNRFRPQHPITLATLLEQTAGLEDLAPRELLPSATVAPLLQEVLRGRAHPSRWAPAERFSPSRVGITAAAAQLERWTHRPFFAIADADLFRPLAMTGSSFRPDLALLDAMAVGHQGSLAMPWSPPQFWPAQGLVTTAEDLGLLLRMVLSGGLGQSGPALGQPLFSPGLLERIRRGRTLGEDVLDAPGLGTRVGSEEGHAGVGEAGVYAGNASALRWFPREQRGYAILLNAASPEALEQIAAAIRRVLFHDVPAEPLPPAPATLDDLARAAGVWRLASVRLEPLRFFDELFSFAVIRAGAVSLEFSFGLGAPRTLLPMGRGAFRGPAEPRASVGLVARAGHEELLAPEGTFVRSSALAAFGRLALTLAALLALASSLLFALIWLPRALFGALRQAPDLRLRAGPALTALVLAQLLALLVFSAQPLGARNLTTLLVCALTLIFPALSLASLLECLRGPDRTGHLAVQAHRRAARLVRAHAFTCALLACWLSFELVAHGLAGIRTWAI